MKKKKIERREEDIEWRGHWEWRTLRGEDIEKTLRREDIKRERH